MDSVSETAWKFRHKIKTLGKSGEQTLSDFTSISSSTTDLKAEVNGDSTPRSTYEPKEASLGANPSVKTYYEGPGSREEYINWVDYPPKELSKSASKSHDRVAIKLFKVKDLDKPVISGRYATKYKLLHVQNPGMVALLEPILKKQDVFLDVNEFARFEEPFRPLFFAYDEIAEKQKKLAANDPLKEHMLLLIRVLDELFGEVRTKKKNLEATGLISFKTAWAYFARDEPVLSRGPNCEYLGKIVDTVYVKTPKGLVLALRVKSLSFNGDAFVWQHSRLEISEFSGNQPVADLKHYPLKFHPNPSKVEENMSQRGREVLKYQGLTYCAYNGIAVYMESPEKIEKHNVDGRILIDVVGYNRHHLTKGARDGLDAFSQKNIVDGTGRFADDVQLSMGSFSKAGGAKMIHNRYLNNGDCEEDLGDDEDKKQKHSAKRLTEEEQEKNTQAMLKKPEDLKFISPLLQGYALKNKLWVMFYVEDIEPMVWNDQAFDHLVYNEEQKDVVLSFVESHGRSTIASMDDVIVGKGCGLIVLLSGPPGTGKTLTAEAVADRTRRPLFYLQAEDLGINASTLGANIKKVFEMANEWDAVILLDEADVFMAERHPQDIARNELVSIFLREIEYFKGILFLTTNLYQTIDTAFRSRVSLHLLFQPLTPEARTLIWRKFLDRLPQTETPKQNGVVASEEGGEEETPDKNPGIISDEEILQLAQWQLNGREIKNAVKMVKTWCDHKKYELTLDRLENGIKVTSPHASKLTDSGDSDLYDD